MGICRLPFLHKDVCRKLSEAGRWGNPREPCQRFDAGIVFQANQLGQGLELAFGRTLSKSIQQFTDLCRIGRPDQRDPLK